MAGGDALVNPSYEQLARLRDEHEARIAALRARVLVVERERDEARTGLRFMTQALRRRGCSDGRTNGAAR
jgi:hypothetical protein